MKNIKILKKVVPLLRENEEIVSIPEKNKKDLFSCIFLCIFSIFISIVLLCLSISSFPSSTTIIPNITAIIFLIIFYLMVIHICNKSVVITNQRLIYFTLFNTICIEKENIESVSYDCMQRGIARKTTVIETKDYKKYKIEFYDYIKIRENLFCDL